MPLKLAQQLFSAYEVSENEQDTSFYVSYLSLDLNNNSDKAVSETLAKISSVLDENHTAKDWKEINKDLWQQIQSDNISGQIMLGLLYLIIGFGVFGTVLMMTAERKREFGVMIAIGMQKNKLRSIVAIEMFLIGIIGTISGIIASIPFVLWGHYNPIQVPKDMASMFEDYNFEPVLPLETIDTYFINQAIVVLVMVFIATIYPILKIGKMKVINAIRG
jgi:ABC-type lipoprotein release transport system permease subunit